MDSSKNKLSHPTSDKDNSHLAVFIFRKLKKAGQPFTNFKKPVVKDGTGKCRR
ncbi:hypothetical protein [Flavobacterium cerinum]|uniref:hypothetical protein n=1 Tax=Flavobacterium cerinum TaxID=2502784 RepID=UPI0013E388E7|nr:hypothetical protein [Flavobacterium cerinum]